MNFLIYIFSIISALIYVFALLFSNKLGFLALFFLIPIYFSIFLCSKAGQASFSGFIWGIIYFGVHFSWLFRVLHQNAHLNFFIYLFLYLIIVFIYSATSLLWFYIAFRLMHFSQRIYSGITTKLLAFSLATFGYFHLQSLYGLFFLGIIDGYPFFSPILLLCRYKWFLYLYTFFITVGRGDFSELKNLTLPKEEIAKIADVVPSEGLKINFPIPLFYIHPDVASNLTNDLSVVGQRIYHKLANLKLMSKKLTSPVLILTPEAAFPFPLNENEDQMKLWNYVLPSEAYFLLGSYRSSNIVKNNIMKNKHFQSVFFIHDGKIIDFYDKAHAVPFFEKIPKFWRSQLWAKEIFIKEAHEISKSKESWDIKRFEIPQKVDLIPQLCSEVFWKRSSIFKFDHFHKENTVIVWLVKETWFMKYFIKLMENFALLLSIKSKVPILYVGYDKVIYFK